MASKYTRAHKRKIELWVYPNVYDFLEHMAKQHNVSMPKFILASLNLEQQYSDYSRQLHQRELADADTL